MKKIKIGDACISTSNIRWRNIDDNNEYKYIDLSSVDRETNSIKNPQIITAKTAPSRAQRIICEGDVIFATTRPTLRRVCIIPSIYDGQICSTGFCVLRPNKNILLSEYLYLMLISNDFYKYIEPLQTGATYPAVSDGDVRLYEIPLPSLSEQRRIVQILVNKLNLISQLKSNAHKTIMLCDEMKQTLLDKMFNGQI